MEFGVQINVLCPERLRRYLYFNLRWKILISRFEYVRFPAVYVRCGCSRGRRKDLQPLKSIGKIKAEKFKISQPFLISSVGLTFEKSTSKDQSEYKQHYKYKEENFCN